MKISPKRFQPAVNAIFILTEAVLYAVFLAYDTAGSSDTVAIKYSGILLCLAVSAAGAYFSKKDGIAVAVAMVFTALSDLFIFVLNDYYELGLVCFIAVQSVYFLRIYMNLRKKPYISLTIRAVCFAVIMIVLGVTGNLQALTALAALYICMLVGNAAESARLIPISKKFILFTVGLWLFVGCDICVGLNNFDILGITLSTFAQKFVGIAMWAFYLPSQVLIVLSAAIVKPTLPLSEKNEE